MSTDLSYLALVFGLFVLPRMLQRLRIPGAITALALGAVCGLGFSLFLEDSTVRLLATFGVVSLFLFAGLDVDVEELRQGSRVLGGHLLVRVALICGFTALAMTALDMDWQPALILALALTTPSTGFILDSLTAFGLDAQERFWVKSKAIASELVALLILFVVLQSSTAARLSLGVLALVALVVVLPPLFRFFVRAIAPFAPNSEFAFLLMMAILAASATRKLGAYYLVGAFVVGMSAQRLREELPSLSSERLVRGLEVFASFFVPFYFFHAGVHLDPRTLTVEAGVLGLIFLAVGIPARVGSVMLVRRSMLGEPWGASARVSLSLVPTLIFTMVLATILQEQYGASPQVIGALLVYAVGTTLLPSVFLRGTPEYAAPRAPPLEVDQDLVKSQPRTFPVCPTEEDVEA